MARNSNKDNDKFSHEMLKIRRVSRMYHGGRRMRFSTFVVVGDKEGQVGVANAKAVDIPSAQNKAVRKAKKRIINVPLNGNTIPHEVQFKFKSSKVLLMPASPGTGIVAGPTVKSVAELAGIEDLLTKVIGSTNTINTAYATVKALESLRRVPVGNNKLDQTDEEDKHDESNESKDKASKSAQADKKLQPKKDKQKKSNSDKKSK